MITMAFTMAAGLFLQQLPCEQVTMRWGDIPAQEVRCVYVDNISVPYAYSTPDDMIVGVKIGQPRDDWDNNCGRNYTVSLSQGVLAIDFKDGGSYYLELTHASGAVSHGSIEVLARYLSVPQSSVNSLADGKPATGPAKKRRIEVDYTKKWLFAADMGQIANHDSKITHKRTATTGSVAEFQQLVCELYDECGGTMPIKLQIVAHGLSVGGVPVGGRAHLGGAGNAPVTPTNAGDYGAAVAGKVCDTNWGTCFGALGTDGTAFLQQYAVGSQATCTGYTGFVSYILDQCWEWSEFGWVNCLKMTTGGDIVEKQPNSQVQSETTIVDTAPTKVRLPLGYGASGVDPVVELWSAVGEPRSVWDLDLDGDVDIEDLDLLLEAIGS